MKELNKKVFRTVFIILSLFVIIGVVSYNVNSYQEEYMRVRRSVSFMEVRNENKLPENSVENPEKKQPENPIENPPEQKEFEIITPVQKNKERENMMIMDSEVYSVILKDGEIEKVINHSNSNNDFDVEEIAKSIINRSKGINIGFLYIGNYAYNYNGDTITIVNTQSIRSRLMETLIKSIVTMIGFEIIIYIVSKILTRRITKPAQESFDKQRDFIADASHELKTPLAVIMASSDELKSDVKNKQYVENIKYESERMSTLIKGLLDLSKLEKGVSIDSYKEENISKIIERTCLTFEGIAFEQSIGIETDIAENITLKCSKEEIEKLVSIVIDNAIKHSYKDSAIKVSLNKDKNNTNLEITNSGDPIKAGDEEKIFERFYRADKSRNRDANRYGLGLAIAKNIVTNHNGTIQAFSKDGKTTFKINFK